MATRSDIQSQDQLRCLLVETLWYVVFEDKPERSTGKFWRLFTRDNFRHCWLYCRDHYNAGWIAIDSTSGGVQIRTYRDEVLLEHGFNSLHELVLAEGSIILPADCFITDEYIRRLIPINCVELAKHVLDINKLTILTPFQLYKYIVNNMLNMFEYNRILELGHK